MKKLTDYLCFVLITLFLFSCGDPVLPGDDSDEEQVILDAVDNSDSKYFPAIGQQGQIAACDWFAAVYYQMTYLYNKENNRSADETNTFYPKFGYTILNNAGPYPFNIRLPDVYEFVKKHGCATMARIPYDMADGKGYEPWCTDGDIWEDALQYRIESYSYIEYNPDAAGEVVTENGNTSYKEYDSYFEKMKQLLSGGEILVIQSFPFPGYEDQGCRLENGIIGDDPATDKDNDFVGQHIIRTGDDNPGHTMALVGYNDHIWVDLNNDGKVQASEKGALKIADSYGADFIPYFPHNDGFFWMAYDTVESSIFMDRMYKMTIRKNYKPKMIAKITLNTAKRDSLQFQFGRSASNINEEIAENNPAVFDPYGLGFETGQAGVSLIEGGNFAFDGGAEAVDGDFTFDLTDLENKTDVNDSDYWYFKIKNNSNEPVLIKDFKIINLKTGAVSVNPGLPFSLVQGETYRFISIDY